MDPPRAPVALRRLGRTVTGSLLVALAVWLLLRTALRIDVPFPLLLVFTVSAPALHRLLSSLGTVSKRAAQLPDRAATGDGGPPQDAVYIASLRWSNRLGASIDDVDRYRAIVEPLLRDLVEERLRLRHGVNMREEPDRARQLIGEPLWMFFHRDVAQPPSLRELESVVAQVESM